MQQHLHKTQTHIEMHFRLSQTQKGYLFSQSLSRDNHRPKYLFTCSPSFLIILMHVLITKMFAHSDLTILILCQWSLLGVCVCAYFQILKTICNNILWILKGYKTKFKRKMAILVFIFSGYRLDWKCNPKHHITSSVVSFREKRCKMMLLLLLCVCVYARCTKSSPHCEPVPLEYIQCLSYTHTPHTTRIIKRMECIQTAYIVDTMLSRYMINPRSKIMI